MADKKKELDAAARFYSNVPMCDAHIESDMTLAIGPADKSLGIHPSLQTENQAYVKGSMMLGQTSTKSSKQRWVC